jgi:hypothetical protein
MVARRCAEPASAALPHQRQKRVRVLGCLRREIPLPTRIIQRAEDHGLEVGGDFVGRADLPSAAPLTWL